MFPLLENSIIGYRFGQKTHYNNFHIGLDLKAFYVDLFAPFDGTVTTSLGKQGGKTITFKPDHQDVVIRFLHLDEFLKTGHVKQGERIAITGNTGVSTNPHLHIDISKHAVDLNNINNFIDPEKFNWKGKSMYLANDNGTVYLVCGNQAKQKIGIATSIDQLLEVFGDEDIITEDTSHIPEAFVLSPSFVISKK